MNKKIKAAFDEAIFELDCMTPDELRRELDHFISEQESKLFDELHDFGNYLQTSQDIASVIVADSSNVEIAGLQDDLALYASHLNHDFLTMQNAMLNSNAWDSATELSQQLLRVPIHVVESSIPYDYSIKMPYFSDLKSTLGSYPANDDCYLLAA